jgi:Ca2+-binding EF-hand superfamily protein
MSDAESQAMNIDALLRDFNDNGNVEAAREAFNTFDKNHDNRVSLDEIWQIFSPHVRRSPDEVYAKVKADFKASDANADGTLDFEEFQAFLRAIS